MPIHAVVSPSRRRLPALVLAACGLLAAPTAAPAQAPTDAGQLTVSDVDDLRVPADPVFVLLDVSPTSVERPSTPRALGLGLLQAVEQSNGEFPQNLAIELAPYWMKSRPALTFEDYYSPRKGLAATVAQTFALSFATADLSVDGEDMGTAAGVGMRFLLRQGRAAPELAGKVEALKKLQLEMLDKCVDEEGVDQTCVTAYEERLRTAAKAVAALDKQRRGFELAFASAVGADVPGDRTSDAEVSRYGAWLTASYRPTHGSLNLLGVARYLRNERDTDPGDAYDLGGRLIWRSSQTSLPLALSIEYVRRFVSDGDDADRLVGVAEVDLPFQNLSLLASYGKTFGDGFQGDSDLVSILGLHLGLGKGPVVQVPSS